jgi:hypothetical protein
MKTIIRSQSLLCFLMLALVANTHASNNDDDEKNKAAKKKIVVNQDSVYRWVETPAQFMRGITDLQTFADRNLSIKPNRQATVKIQFVIERYGLVSNVAVVEGAEYTEESHAAIQLIKDTILWKPAQVQFYAVGSVNEIVFEFGKKGKYLGRKTILTMSDASQESTAMKAK